MTPDFPQNENCCIDGRRSQCNGLFSTAHLAGKNRHNPPVWCHGNGQEFMDILSNALSNDKSAQKVIAESLLSDLITIAETARETGKLSLHAIWSNPDNFRTHLKKRLERGWVTDESDYEKFTFNVLRHSEIMLVALPIKGLASGKLQIEAEGWVVILGMDGRIVTSYPREASKQTFEQNHKRFGDLIYEFSIPDAIRKMLERLFA